MSHGCGRSAAADGSSTAVYKLHMAIVGYFHAYYRLLLSALTNSGRLENVGGCYLHSRLSAERAPIGTGVDQETVIVAVYNGVVFVYLVDYLPI